MLSTSPAHRLSSNSVSGLPSKHALMGEGRAAGLVFELMIALPDDPAVFVVAVPDLRAVPPAAAPAPDLPGEYGGPHYVLEEIT